MKKNNLSKIDLLVYFIIKINNDDIFALASQLAYYLMLTFFPLIIFIMSIVSFMNFDSVAVINGLQTILPKSVIELTETIIVQVFEYQNTGILGGSFLAIIWAASAGFRGLSKAVDKAYGLTDNRNVITRTIVSLIGTILLGLAIIGSLAILVFGNVISKHLLKQFNLPSSLNIIWNTLRYGAIIVILIFIFAAIYKFLPSKKVKWREAIVGAIISAVGWVSVSMIFSFYINNFNNYSKIYGSLATVFILMIWLFLSSIILIFGVEVNSAISNKNKLIEK